MCHIQLKQKEESIYIEHYTFTQRHAVSSHPDQRVHWKQLTGTEDFEYKMFISTPTDWHNIRSQLKFGNRNIK